MPSTETRRYADLIVLIRECVNDAIACDNWKEVAQPIWDIANDDERGCLTEFGTWFTELGTAKSSDE